MVVPEPKNSPVPIVPPIAIIWTLRLLNERIVPSAFSVTSFFALKIFLSVKWLTQLEASN